MTSDVLSVAAVLAVLSAIRPGHTAGSNHTQFDNAFYEAHTAGRTGRTGHVQET